MDVAFYAIPGPLTELTDDQAALVRRLDPDPLALCRVAQGLLVSPSDAATAGLPDARMEERNIRPAASLMRRLLELDPMTPLDRPRAVENRVVGTCRHFAVMATAFLRSAGVPARARCGFGTYFIPPKKVDHWVVEHWTPQERRWVRIDPEYVGRMDPATARCDDLRPGEFLTGGEAWQLIRSGQMDAVDFGVFGTENWGAGEVRGNAMRDLASVFAKVEMLPWDEWGPMEDSYNGATGDDFDRLIDELSVAVRDDDLTGMRRIDTLLAVPAAMIG